MADPRFLPLLLATEHGEFDTAAEAVALGLARRWRQPLAAVLPITSNAELESVAPQVVARREAEAAAQRTALEAEAATQGVALQLQVRRGPAPAVEILTETARLGSGLLVIRRRGRRGLLANLLVGEMVNQVLGEAACSVLVCPVGSALWQRRVLLAIDPLAPDAAATAAAIALAADTGLPLDIACGVVPGRTGATQDDAARTALQAAQAQAQQAGVAAEGHVLQHYRVHDALVRLAAARGVDLIVLGRRRAGALGSLAHKVLGLAACPVLIHRAGA